MSELQIDAIVVCPKCGNRSSTATSNYKCKICGNDIKEQFESEIKTTNMIRFCLFFGFVFLIILTLQGI